MYFQGLRGLEGGTGRKYISGMCKMELLVGETPELMQGGSRTMHHAEGADSGIPLVLCSLPLSPQPHFAAMIPSTWAISASDNQPFLNEPTISPATRQAVKITSAFLSVLRFPPREKCPGFYLSPLLKNLNDGN